MWIRWRHLYREGPGDWSWRAVSDRECLGELGRELRDDTADPDSYRGVQVEACEPPIDVLEELVEKARRLEETAIRVQVSLEVQLAMRRARSE